MRAQTGDRIAIETTTLDVRARGGVVLEVLGSNHEPPYRVRWDDGHESVYFPGPDAHVVSPPENDDVDHDPHHPKPTLS